MLSMGQPDVKGIYMVDNFMEDSFFSLFFYLYCQLVATCLLVKWKDLILIFAL
jgi:hypothetical protein